MFLATSQVGVMMCERIISSTIGYGGKLVAVYVFRVIASNSLLGGLGSLLTRAAAKVLEALVNVGQARLQRAAGAAAAASA